MASGLAVGYLVGRDIDPTLMLGGVLALVCGAVLVLNPKAGMLLLIFITFTRASESVPQIRSLPSLTTMIAAGLGLITIYRRMWFGERITGWQRPLLFLSWYGLLGLMSLLYAVDVGATTLALTEFFKDALVVFVVAILIRRANDFYYALWALLAAGTFLGTLNVIQQLTGTQANPYFGFSQVIDASILTGEPGLRLVGPGMDPNSYAQYMLFLVPLAFERFLNENRRVLKLLALWALMASLLAIIFTFSRSVFVALAVVLVVFFYYHPPRLAHVVLVVLVGLALLPVLPDQYTERMRTLVYLIPGISDRSDSLEDSVSQDISFRGRLSENIVGLQVSLDYPILGVGLDNFKAHYQDYSEHLGLDRRREGRSSHNLYLEIAAEFGFMGLLWLIALNVVAFRGLSEARQTFRQLGLYQYEGIALAFAITLIGFLVGSIFRHMTYPRYVWLLYTLILILPHIARLELRERLLERRPLYHSEQEAFE